MHFYLCTQSPKNFFYSSISVLDIAGFGVSFFLDLQPDLFAYFLVIEARHLEAKDANGNYEKKLNQLINKANM